MTYWIFSTKLCGATERRLLWYNLIGAQHTGGNKFLQQLGLNQHTSAIKCGQNRPRGQTGSLLGQNKGHFNLNFSVTSASHKAFTQLNVTIISTMAEYLQRKVVDYASEV